MDADVSTAGLGGPAQHLPVEGFDETGMGGDPVVERHSIDFIPHADRRRDDVRRLGSFWFVYVANLSTIAVGFLGVAVGLGLTWTLIAAVLGVAMGTMFTAFHSAQGPQMGLPQMIQSRAQFGYAGAILPLTLAFLILVGFNIFNGVLIGDSLNEVFGWSVDTGIILGCVLSTVLAILGYKWIHNATRVLFWISIPLFVVLSVKVIVDFHLSTEAPHAGAFSWAGILAVFVASTAFMIAYAPYVSDYSRYFSSKTKPSRTLFWTFAGMGGGGVWFILLGALLANQFPGVAAPAPAIEAAGNGFFDPFGGIVVVASLMVLLLAFGANSYSAGLAFLPIVDAVKNFRDRPADEKPPSVSLRIAVVIVITIIAGIVAHSASANFLTNWGNFLSLLGYLLIPWTVVNLVDFYFVRKGHYSITELFDPRGMYGRWGRRGLISYTVGFIVMIPFFNIGTWYHGPIADSLGGTDISIFIGLGVAGSLYYWLTRSLDVEHELDGKQGDILAGG